MSEFTPRKTGKDLYVADVLQGDREVRQIVLEIMTNYDKNQAYGGSKRVYLGETKKEQEIVRIFADILRSRKKEDKSFLTIRKSCASEKTDLTIVDFNLKVTTDLGLGNEKTTFQASLYSKEEYTSLEKRIDKVFKSLEEISEE